MKILFIAKGDLPDFQSDMVFHGLRSLFGADVWDANRIWHMYKKDKEAHWKERVPNEGSGYGRGFTLYGTLDDVEEHKGLDSKDIVDKIRGKYFDVVVYGSITRCQDYLQEVMKVYNKGRVVFIDGEDNQGINYQLIDAGGHLFKRELATNVTDRLHSLNFCVPEDKIISFVPEKTQDWGTVKPGQLDTYIFTEEKAYYEDYQKSYFGLTTKKGGWDCLRHYEIMMNGCVPYFPDIENCPAETMMAFPKDKIKESNEVIRSAKIGMNWHKETIEFLLEHTRKYCTTKAEVTKMLETIQ